MRFSPESLQRLRGDAGLSTTQLAAAAGLTEMTVRGYEAGRRVPSVDRAIRLAAALGCQLTDLVAAA
jgi:transcriptional regulator with XRE-family HTH domain